MIHRQSASQLAGGIKDAGALSRALTLARDDSAPAVLVTLARRRAPALFEAFLAVVRLFFVFVALFFLVLLFVVLFFWAPLVLAAFFRAPAFVPALFFGAGTFAPARRASDKPIAMACFRLLTVLPLFPLFRVPALRSCIAFFTFCFALLPYLAISVSLQ